jgi:phosphatidylglycerophosphate synthase
LRERRFSAHAEGSMTAPSLVYTVDDRSILLPHYRRLCVDPLLRFVPATLSPNTITHAGHIANLIGTAMLMTLWPRGGWAFIAAALLLQVYNWCDNADGAHARRTGQCSAFGEFLDHGLDTLNVTYIGLLTCMALGAPAPWWVALSLLIPGAAAVTYWEQSQTGTFRLGLINQVESTLLLSSMLVLSGVLGSDWTRNVSAFGVTLQTAFLVWTTAQIGTGVLRAMVRVARIDVGAVASLLALVAFDIAVAAAAALGTMTVASAVLVGIAATAFFCMRMICRRLEASKPRIEREIVVGTFVLAAATGVHLAMKSRGYEALLGPALTTVASAVFAMCAVVDARYGIQRLEQMEQTAPVPAVE